MQKQAKKAVVFTIILLVFISTLVTATPKKEITGMDRTQDLRNSDKALPNDNINMSRSGNVVTFRDDHIMLINGEPFFPIGTWHWRRDPWNCVNNYTLFPCSLEGYEGDDMHIFGEDLFSNMTNYSELRYQEALQCIEHPNFLGWFSADEPVWVLERFHPPGFPQLDFLQMLYDRLKEDDPGHPVWMNFAAADISDDLDIWIAKRQPYVQAADIICMDVYPKWTGPGSEQCRPGSPWCVLENSNVSVVGEFVDLLVHNITAGQKPIWFIPQAWGDVNEHEIRFQSWQAIIHGSTGLFHWYYPKDPYRLVMPDAEHVAQELVELHPVLVAYTINASVTSTPGIETMVKKVDDFYYILSVNRESEPALVSAEFDLTSLNITGNGTAEILNKGATVDVINGRFSLEYIPFDTHIIQIPDFSTTIDPDRSSIMLSEGGLTTCPAGDELGWGAAYTVPRITLQVFNLNQDPLSGVPADGFDFQIMEVPGDTHWYNELSCIFTPMDVKTNATGIIQFDITGNTSIAGNVIIQPVVQNRTLNDSIILFCNSYDYYISESIPMDGVVGLQDFGTFASDWASASWQSDFNWNGFVELVDFAMFASHWGHQH